MGPFIRHCVITGTSLNAVFDYTHESEWTTLSGTFDIRRGSLRVQSPGEVEYASDEIPANAAIVLGFFSVDEMKVEIRARRDGGDYVCLAIDMEANTISLLEYEGGVSTVLATQAHTFYTDPSTLYEIGFWLYDDSLIGFVNGAYIIGATSALNVDKTGWSLYVPEIYENIITSFKLVRVYTIKEYPSSPTIPDVPSDYHQQYRKKLKGYCETPADISYQSFLHARTSWEKMKDFGKKDEQWAELGYPIYPPMPENWD